MKAKYEFLVPPRNHILLSFPISIFIFCIHFLNVRTKTIGYPIWHSILFFFFFLFFIINFGTWFLHMKKRLLISLICSQSSILFFIFYFFLFIIFFFTKVPLNSFCWKWKCQKVVFSYSVFILTFFGYWKKKEGFSLVDLIENRK